MSEIEQSPLHLRRIKVRATREVAYESPDHQVPTGTRRDNSRQKRFNQKLYLLFGEFTPLWVLDMGCSGGGFVKDCLDDGSVAVGLEGSDYSKKMRRAEWRTIPEYLFTADITAPFDISGEFTSGERPILFDVVTSWEVMEHIHERDLGTVIDNVKRHLRPGGLWIMSVTPMENLVNGVNLHQNTNPREWWIKAFADKGLNHYPEYLHYFNTQFVRGTGYKADPGTFHLVLTNDRKLAPTPPRESLTVRLYDKWLGSTPQRLLQYAVSGL